MVFDLIIAESKDGGDLQKNGNDLKVTNGIENLVYLALFGGNEKQSLEKNNITEQDFSWWGNALLMADSPDQQFNSDFERTLNNTELSSSGRVKIENAAKKDLAFIKKIGTLTVEVTIPTIDTVSLKVTIIQNIGITTIIIINFKKQSAGDFDVLDFISNDFLT